MPSVVQRQAIAEKGRTGTLGQQTPQGFALKLDALARDLQGRYSVAAVNKGALAAKNAINAQLGRKIPSRRLRNVGKNGSKLSVRYDVRGEKNPTALVRAIGPWQIIEDGTKPHIILPKSVGKGGRGKAGKRAAKHALYSALFGSSGFSGSHPLRTPYGPRFKVNHPGTSGKHPWRDGASAAKKVAPKAMAAQAQADIRGVFGGR